MPKGDGNFSWYYGGGNCPDSYYHGGDTREQTLKEAWSTYPEGDFTIVEADKCIPNFDVLDTDQVLERYEEHNEECWGEDGAEIHPTSEQSRELEKILAEALEMWMDRHNLRGNLWSFGDTRVEEYLAATEDVATQPILSEERK